LQQSVASPLIVAYVVCCPFPRGKAAEAFATQMVMSIYNLNQWDEICSLAQMVMSIYNVSQWDKVCSLEQWQRVASKAATRQW
jgi:hypothetical protein